MGWGGPGPMPMAECLLDRGAGAAGMRTSGGWGSFSLIHPWVVGCCSSWRLLRAAIKRRGVVLLGLLVYALL